jgi:4a-hydroxytetrahydrobiopterin dehydratase
MAGTELANKPLSTYRTGTPPLIRKEVAGLLREVPGWTLESGHLKKTFSFDDAGSAIDFLTGTLIFAQQEGHIPDISLSQGRHVLVSWYTYPAGGLTLNDFIMAAKLDARAEARNQ